MKHIENNIFRMFVKLLGVRYTSYFSNIDISIFIPILLPCVYFMNILILPYSFWSVWYQKIKVN